MFKVIIRNSAGKKIAKFPPSIKERIVKTIELLRFNPYLGKKLHGELAGSFRLRVGDFRIVYDILREENLVILHAIGSRGDIYK